MQGFRFLADASLPVRRCLCLIPNWSREGRGGLLVDHGWTRQPIAVSDISVYICLINIRDSSSKPVYGGVDCLMIGTYSYAYLWYTM